MKKHDVPQMTGYQNFKYHIIEFYFFAFAMLSRPRVLVSVILFFVMFMPSSMIENEVPTFRIVIDPGHGGIGLHPMSVHGDRYDTVNGRYLDFYKEGAERGGLHERVIVYSIAKKTEKLLKCLVPGRNGLPFYRLLEKYSDGNPPRIHVITYMSRGRSVNEADAHTQEDPNAPFRLFDFPDTGGHMHPGRISRINEVKPHLVVSLHLAGSGPRDFEGMNPVIIPPYGLLKQGFDYLNGKQAGKKFFYASPYSDWFIEETTRSDFEWFLNDASLYFMGYPIRRNLEPDRTAFKGYRYNMVQWSYADDRGWEHAARYHIRGSRYAAAFGDFAAEGRFWNRERSRFERFRREGGEEGFGGDNAYASYEIIRYICYALHLHGDDYRTQKPGKSYISVWIVPLHVNAINAFIELGYLNRSRDRYLLTSKQDELAEGIAVGIFSLLTGLKLREPDFKYAPKGKSIDFKKYDKSNNSNYFDSVVP